MGMTMTVAMIANSCWMISNAGENIRLTWNLPMVVDNFLPKNTSSKRVEMMMIVLLVIGASYFETERNKHSADLWRNWSELLWPRSLCGKLASFSLRKLITKNRKWRSTWKASENPKWLGSIIPGQSWLLHNLKTIENIKRCSPSGPFAALKWDLADIFWLL